MDFRPEPGDVEFREEVRDFLRHNLPSDLAARNRGVYHPSPEDMRAWTRILHARGWSAPSWPKRWGGTGWSLMQRAIFTEECHFFNAPPTNLQGFSLVGPVIYTFGSDAQKAEYLPKILSGDQLWAQGFSEPNAGSDLASLTTRAERDGDAFVVNGQKTWTSFAHEADMIFCLVKTNRDVKPQQGISFLLIDTKTPGVTIRNFRSIDGGRNLNEVFLEDVRVPAQNLVGEIDKGWTYAKFLLGNERASSSADLPYSKHGLERLRAIAMRQDGWGRRLIDDPLFAARLVMIEADLRALEVAVERVIADRGEATEVPITSVLKVRGSELQQRISEMLVEAHGVYGMTEYPEWPRDHAPDLPWPGPEDAPGISADFLYRRAATIFGGANEVQRTIIAKRILKL